MFENIACTVCGCVCDDLRIHVEGDQVLSADGACHLSEPWFLNQHRNCPPLARVRGASVSLEQGLNRAAEILGNARAPLIYGLSRSATAGQQAATALGDYLGAIIDTTASLCHAPSVIALQEAGESTCTLGEVKNRADLVIFWGCNPPQSHPRHFERYSLLPEGQFVPQGRRDRRLVVVDVERTAAAEAADLFISVEPNQDYEAIWSLRAMLREQELEGERLGARREHLQLLAQWMRSCRFGIVFFGLGLSMRGVGHRNVEALLHLVTDLNRFTRFYARRMRVLGDVTGADSVLAWQTGYPFSVSLARDYPRYNPGEFSAQELLDRREVDACLLVGSEGIWRFSDAALDHLRRIPTILLEYPSPLAEAPKAHVFTPTVQITTAIYGVHVPGTAYRMDEVPIPLRSFLQSHYASDEEVLGRLLEMLR